MKFNYQRIKLSPISLTKCERILPLKLQVATSFAGKSSKTTEPIGIRRIDVFSERHALESVGRMPWEFNGEMNRTLQRSGLCCMLLSKKLNHDNAQSSKG